MFLAFRDELLDLLLFSTFYDFFFILFLFCAWFVHSAVDQFRKQFAHLEENGGKSGPVIPLERKHVSLPR